MKTFRPLFFVFLLFFALAFAAYHFSLRNHFIIDDHSFFSDSKILSLKYILIQFIPDRDRYLKVDGGKADGYYRPLAHIVPMLEFAVFKLNGFWYHFVNIFFYAVAGMALYLFIFKLFQEKTLAFLSAVVFILHPINTVAINYKTATCFSLEVIFMLVSLYVMLEAQSRIGIGKRIVSIVFYILAVFCHESAMFLPFFLVFFYIVALRLSFKKALSLSLWHFAVLSVYLVFRYFYSSLKVNIIDHYHTFNMSSLDFIASFAAIIGWYLKQYFYPDGIVLIWVTPVVKFSLWQFLKIFAFMAGLICFYKISSVKFKMAIGWFLIALIPVIPASLFRPALGVSIEPHWLIFGSLGLALFVGLVLEKLKAFVNWKIFLTVFVLLGSFLIYYDHRYSYIWADEIRFCQFWMKKAPYYKDAMLYLSDAYKYKGDLKTNKALNEIILQDHYFDQYTYATLMMYAIEEKDFDRAQGIGMAIIKADPNSSATYSNLGIVYKEKKDYPKALECLQKAIQINPMSIEARLNRMSIYLLQGQKEKALNEIQGALAIEPQNVEILWQLIMYYGREGNFVLIPKYAKELITNIEDAPNLVDFALRFNSVHLYNFAIDAFKKAFAIDSRYKPIYVEEGKMLKLLKRNDLAVQLWARALEIFPADEEIQALLNEARKI